MTRPREGQLAGTMQTITALVLDRPGVLNRIASMFRRRGFNIASLVVGKSEIPDQSRMTFVIDSNDAYVIEQVTKQLRKVIGVVQVNDLSNKEIIARELAVVKVSARNSKTRAELTQIAELFKAKIVDVGSDNMIIEVTGDEDKIGALLELTEGFGIQELMRTGRVAMVRGKRVPEEPTKDKI